jgi:hypothetical protein
MKPVSASWNEPGARLVLCDAIRWALRAPGHAGAVVAQLKCCWHLFDARTKALVRATLAEEIGLLQAEAKVRREPSFPSVSDREIWTEALEWIDGQKGDA